jgi:hypothetical protein
MIADLTVRVLSIAGNDQSLNERGFENAPAFQDQNGSQLRDERDAQNGAMAYFLGPRSMNERVSLDFEQSSANCSRAARKPRGTHFNTPP